MKQFQWARFVRFNLVGLLGVAVQLAMLGLLTKRFAVTPMMATAMAVEITLVHNFVWHERFTWGEWRAKAWRERVVRLGGFHLANGLVSLVGNTFVSYWLVQRMKVAQIPAALAGIGVCSLVNFALADGVFRGRG